MSSSSSFLFPRPRQGWHSKSIWTSWKKRAAIFLHATRLAHPAACSCSSSNSTRLGQMKESAMSGSLFLSRWAWAALTMASQSKSSPIHPFLSAAAASASTRGNWTEGLTLVVKMARQLSPRAFTVIGALRRNQDAEFLFAREHSAQLLPGDVIDRVQSAHLRAILGRGHDSHPTRVERARSWEGRAISRHWATSHLV